MTWHTITGPANNTSTRFGGEQMNKISNMFNEVDIGDTVSIHSSVLWAFADDGLLIEASGDRTKKAQFDMSGITSAETRIYSWPDFDMEVGQSVLGKHDKWIDPLFIYPTVTNGCAARAQIEFGTNDVNVNVLDFDDTIEENAQFTWYPPRYYDGTAVTIKILWSVTGGSAAEVVRFGVKARARADGGTMDTTFGTEVVIDDTFIANDALHITDFTTDVTPTNAAKNTQIVFNIARKAAATEDTLTGDARVMGVQISWHRDSAIAAA